MKNSLKKLYKKIKYMDKTKARYFTASIFISTFCLFTGITYSYFTFSKHLNAAIITTAKLKYSLTSTNTSFKNNSITVPPGTTILELDLKSLNTQNTKYALDNLSTSPNVKVYYVGEREQNVLGEIGGLNSIITIKIAISNTGSSSETVSFDLKGGYLQNELDSNITEAKPSSPLLAVSYNYNEKLWAHKSDITKIVLEDTLSPKTDATYSYDISSEQDESIMSYLVPNSDDTSKYTAYIQANGKLVANKNSSYLFKDFINLTSIENLDKFDTGNVTNMTSMFHNCNNITVLDLSNFDTNNVNYMIQMFYNCKALTSLDVSNFDTSKTNNMYSMFHNCNNLTTLDVSNFDTRNVTNMYSMFNNCKNLTTLDVSNFNTSNVFDMSFMFCFCEKLSNIDVSNFDTSNVTNMAEMFYYCKALTSLDVSNFDTSNVTKMYGMFTYCSTLSSLNLSNFDTSKVTDMGNMFLYCRNITSLDLTNFNTSNVTDMGQMFSYCTNLSNLDLSSFNTSNVTDMGEMFAGSSKLTTTITIRGTKCTNYTNMFSYTATISGSKIIVNYTSDASTLVNNMLATKSSSSKVVKGTQVS